MGGDVKMIVIDVTGTPRPGGSKTPGYNAKTGKSWVKDACKFTATWRQDVQVAAMQQYSGPLLGVAIEMTYEFRFARPKSHFGSGKNSTVLKKTAPYWHTIKPDLTKIIRSTEDALTGMVYRDDSIVCRRTELKRYVIDDERPGVAITVMEIE